MSNPTGPLAVYDSDNTSSVVPAAFADVPNLTVDFTPPTAGWIIQVGGFVSMASNTTSGATDTVECQLEENAVVMSGTIVRGRDTHDASGTRKHGFTLPTSFIRINPAPGTPLAYRVQCQTGGGPIMNYNDNAEDSQLWLIATPPR